MILVTGFSVLIIFFEIFCSESNSDKFQAWEMFILLCVFLVVVNYHGRLVDITSRLDFLWKQVAERELQDMTETRQNNSQLLRNILPDHVANHFLTNERRAEVWIYNNEEKFFLFFKNYSFKPLNLNFRNFILSKGITWASCLPAFLILQNFILKM